MGRSAPSRATRNPDPMPKPGFHRVPMNTFVIGLVRRHNRRHRNFGNRPGNLPMTHPIRDRAVALREAALREAQELEIFIRKLDELSDIGAGQRTEKISAVAASARAASGIETRWRRPWLSPRPF